MKTKASRWNTPRQAIPSWLLLCCALGIVGSAGSHAAAQSGLAQGVLFASMPNQEDGEAGQPDASLPPADAVNPEVGVAVGEAGEGPGATGSNLRVDRPIVGV